MELLEGGARRAVPRGPLPPPEAVVVALAVLAALEAFHKPASFTAT